MEGIWHSRPHKLSDCARTRLVRAATKTPMTTLKELKASLAEMGKTLCVHMFCELCVRVARKKTLLKKAL